MIADRLCVERHSPHFVKDHHPVRISIDGVEVTGTVIEYCISKGWARVHKAGGIETSPGKRGATSTKMRRGKIVVWYEGAPVPHGALTDQVTA